MASTTSETKETVDRRLDQDLKTVVAMLLYDSQCNFEIPVADGVESAWYVLQMLFLKPIS